MRTDEIGVVCVKEFFFVVVVVVVVVFMFAVVTLPTDDPFNNAFAANLDVFRLVSTNGGVGIVFAIVAFDLDFDVVHAVVIIPIPDTVAPVAVTRRIPTTVAPAATIAEVDDVGLVLFVVNVGATLGISVGKFR
jgi:hypothetical protein